MILREREILEIENEALDRILYRTRYVRGYGLLVRQDYRLTTLTCADAGTGSRQRWLKAFMASRRSETVLKITNPCGTYL